VGTNETVKEVLTCPGCLEPFGITSPERYEQFRQLTRATAPTTAPQFPAVAEDPRFGPVPVVKPDPAGGYRCPRCGHVVA
jgi:hypothetical protein